MKVIAVFVLAIASVLSSVLPIRPHAELASNRVVGGREAKPHSAPFVVSFQELDEHFCGGSIINEFWIVSAAHCFRYVRKAIAVAGLHSLKDHGQIRNAELIIMHEKYGGSVGPYDIAIIKVDVPFEFNEFVRAVSLPQAGSIHSGDVSVFGWGSISKTEVVNMPDTLQTVTKPILEYSQCREAVELPDLWRLQSTNVCTGPLTGGVSACSRDSGGPLVQRNWNGDYELVGIVSWGYYPCGVRPVPSVYTRVSTYIGWINDNYSSIPIPAS